MKYLTLIYRNADVEMTPEIFEAYRNLTQELGAKGVLQGGNPLKERSSGFRVTLEDKETKVTNGAVDPEAHQLVGYFLVECPSDIEATEIARRIPDAAHGVIEMRPVLHH